MTPKTLPNLLAMEKLPSILFKKAIVFPLTSEHFIGYGNRFLLHFIMKKTSDLAFR
jgi:hypothetical protein